MRKTLLGTLLLGGALILGPSGAYAQAANTVTLSTGQSCVYTSIAMLTNGVINVTCGGGAVTPPAAPTIGTATPLNASISVAFTPPAGTVTSYAASCTSSDGGAPGTASGGTSPLTVGSLTNDKTYTCTVTATNAGGTSSPSAASAPVTPSAGAAATPPGAPTIGAATPGNGSASIAFTAPASNGGATITAYDASCTPSGGGAAVTGTNAASPVTVSGLTNGTAYTCAVTATNSAGTGAASGTVSVTPAAPTAPGAPTIGAVTAGNGSASVAFTAPASNGGSPITSYTASCTPTGGGAAVTGTGATSPITVNGLTNGTAYTCSVTATNAAGTSTPSAAGGVTPVAGCSAPSGTIMGTLNATGNKYNQTESGTIPVGGTKAFAFVAESSVYPYGMKFEIESGYNSGAYNPKDISVSTCPGVFDGLAYPCKKSGVIANRISTAAVGNATSLCEVIPGQTYYFNVRPTTAGQDAAAMINPMAR